MFEDLNDDAPEKVVVSTEKLIADMAEPDVPVEAMPEEAAIEKPAEQGEAVNNDVQKQIEQLKELQALRELQSNWERPPAAEPAPAAKEKSSNLAGLIILLVGIAFVVLAGYVCLDIAKRYTDAKYHNPANVSKIKAAVQRYNNTDDQILGQTYIEGARLVRNGEIKSYKEFLDWKMTNEEDEEGNPAGNRQDNYVENLKPIFDSVNHLPESTDTEQLAKTLEAVGKGWFK